MIYLDFERNISGDYYIAGFSRGGSVTQIVLTERLSGLAAEKGFSIKTPSQFVEILLNEALENNETIVAYSTAEKNYIDQLVDFRREKYRSIKYLNMRKAALSWARRYRRLEFESLPPLVLTATDYEQRRHRKSLASIARLIGFEAPRDYAIGHTTQRFNQVIAALELREQNYQRLTRVQKAKCTGALKHNWFDVMAMVKLFDAILADDANILSASVSQLFD